MATNDKIHQFTNKEIKNGFRKCTYWCGCSWWCDVCNEKYCCALYSKKIVPKLIKENNPQSSDKELLKKSIKSLYISHERTKNNFLDNFFFNRGIILAIKSLEKQYDSIYNNSKEVK